LAKSFTQGADSMDKSKSNTLKWFIDFMNVDVKKLPYPERMKLSAEIQGRLHPRESYDEIRPEIAEQLTQMKVEEIRSFQDHLQNFFGFMKKRLDDVLTSGDGIWRSDDDIEFFPWLNSYEVPIKINFNVAGIQYDNRKKKTGQGDEKYFFRTQIETLNNAKIQLEFSADSDEQALLFSFIMLLEDLPITAFSECAECGKWFINARKGIKLYCSNNCAARKGNRDRRARMKKEDPEGYKKELDKNAQRARSSYERKTKAENPNVKIARRPRKKKVE